MTDRILFDRLRSALDYEPEAGLLRWKIHVASRVPGDVAGNMSHGYIEVALDGERFRAHHLAWFFVHGHFPPECIDHIDGDRKNNRINNLRLASKGQNAQNRWRVSSSKVSSKLLGVTWHKQAQRWMAQIRVNGKSKNLGLFDTENDAHIAYMHAKKELHPFGEIANADLPPLPKKRSTADSSLSGYKGVSLDKRRGTWGARISINGRYKSLGNYATPEEAYAVCEAARRQNRGIETMRADSELV